MTAPEASEFPAAFDLWRSLQPQPQRRLPVCALPRRFSFCCSANISWPGPALLTVRFKDIFTIYIANEAVSFYRPVLSGLVLPHAVVFGYVVGVVEIFIGLSLLLGLWVRPASVLGALYMLNFVLATWWGPGHGAPVWRYFGAELDHLPLLLLFIIFFAADAGRFWGLDGLASRK
jgi:uncharacterized membrane protein YphA (DoxX/SURF4 family)